MFFFLHFCRQKYLGKIKKGKTIDLKKELHFERVNCSRWSCVRATRGQFVEPLAELTSMSKICGKKIIPRLGEDEPCPILTCALPYNTLYIY